MKPNWKDAPDWANWLAQDYDGVWQWYELKPSSSQFIFGIWLVEYCEGREGGEGRQQLAYSNENWKNTLEGRGEHGNAHCHGA